MDYREIVHEVSTDYTQSHIHMQTRMHAHTSNKVMVSDELKSERALLGNESSRKERAIQDIYIKYCTLHVDILSFKK